SRAREEIERLLAFDPTSKEYRRLAASILVGLGEHQKAIEFYDELLAETPRSPEVNLWLGHALKTTGSLEDAVRAYRTAGALRPDFGDAYWSLANLKTYRFTDEEIGCMREQENAQSTGLADRFHLCFALGKALEDRGQFAESWTYYGRGNDLKRGASLYRSE